MITLYLNCAKVWTHLVRGVCRLTGRPQVTYEAPPLPGRASTNQEATDDRHHHRGRHCGRARTIAPARATKALRADEPSAACPPRGRARPRGTRRHRAGVRLRWRGVAGVRIGARRSRRRVALRRCADPVRRHPGAGAHRPRAVVGAEHALRHPARVGALRSWRRARRRATTVGRARHHVGLGDPGRLRLCRRRGGDGGVEIERRFGRQAGDGPRAQRVPRRRAAARAGRPPARTRPDGRRAAPLVLLDFAEQPDDGLAGLDWGEQFHGGTQLRYQLNSLAWAMSLYAANYVPNRRSDDRALAGGAQAHRPAGVGVLAHAQPARQLRPEPRPDPPRQHHVLGVPRRRRQQLRGGDRATCASTSRRR